MALSVGRWWRRRSLRALLAVGVSVLAVAALVPLRDHVRNTNLALVLVIVVLAAAAIGGRLVGVVVGIAVAIAFDFFLTEPFESFAIARPDDVQTTVLLAAVGLIGGELVERARRSEAEADARRREVEQFQRRAELAAWGEPPGRLISRGAGGARRAAGASGRDLPPGPGAGGAERAHAQRCAGSRGSRRGRR